MRTSRRPIFIVLVSPRMGRAVVVLFVALVAVLSATAASGRERAQAACADLVQNDGAQHGATSYQHIVTKIKPSHQPAVYPQNIGAITALKNRQIDGLVVDLPSAFYVTAVQVPNSKILGQFTSPPGGEHFGMIFQ